ncbi:MAG: ABC transporter ATP-binding protein [Gammaproteobacteria bacterium]|nr:ABC transporter ATP-binding protein [Gammaproteobacteria bacterium]
MTEKRKTILRLNKISKIYQTGETRFYALKDINLDIFEGEFLVILGPSGSGKTTLLNILGGTDSPSSGNIFYRDQDLTKANDAVLTQYRRNEVGFVFQFYNLLPTLTAKENVEVATAIAKKPMRPEEALQLVDIMHRANHFPAQMSGGEQQRVTIARAIAKKPAILLCDEPTGALDTHASKNILSILLSICREMKKNVILITHNRELAKIADRIIYLKDGQIENDMKQTSPISVEELVL